MNERPVIIENRNDPARIEARRERAQRNRDWLDAHLDRFLPQAYGKLVAVAGQEAFIAESVDEAKAWARAAHPEDDGLVIRVMPLEHQLSYPYQVTFEIKTDPDEIAVIDAIHRRAKLNRDWLQAHRADILPQARGKFVAVAGQEALIAETPEEAQAMAKAAHPDDDGSFGQYVPVTRGPIMRENPITMEIVDDPIEVARSRAQHERAKRNLDWLESHWADILPEARGRFLAVAGQEAFIADTHEEAWAKARAAHPDDDGAISQYVRFARGPRIYANRRQMVGR